jgi:hypothetical protein
MSLGQWAGRGDWAQFSQESRDRAGIRALDGITAAIDELTAFRERLAAAVLATTSEQEGAR